MSQQRSYSFSHNNTGFGLPIESDKVVMSRDAEMYVKKIELEVKKLHNVKRAFGALKKDRDERMGRCKVLQKNLDASIHKVNNIKNASLVKQKTHFLKKHDEIMEKVFIMKQEIETLRRARMRHLDQINTGWDLVDQKENHLEHIKSVLEERKQITVQHQEQMYDLNIRNEEEKQQYVKKFDQIQGIIDQEKRDRDFAKKHDKPDTEQDYLAGTFDTSSILKKRLQKIMLKNKEKVKIMDTYMRFLTVIDNCFNQIKETTGITDIKEIQNTFIKSEEQNHSLLTYVDLLHQQIDHLQDQNVELDKKIEQQIQDNQEKRRILSCTPDEVTQQRRLESIINKKEKDIQNFQQLLGEIQPDMEQILKNLAESQFNRDRMKQFEYRESNVNLNDKTISTYFGDLEDFTNQLLNYESQKGKQGQTNLLFTETIPQKDFTNRIHKPVALNQQHMGNIPQEERKYISKQEFDNFAHDYIERKIKNRDIDSKESQRYRDEQQYVQ